MHLAQSLWILRKWQHTIQVSQGTGDRSTLDPSNPCEPRNRYSSCAYRHEWTQLMLMIGRASPCRKMSASATAPISSKNR